MTGQAAAIGLSREQLVGRKLRQIRQARRLSREDLAAKAGMLPGDLLRIEKGEHRVNLDTLFLLLGQIGISLDDFLAGLRRDAARKAAEDLHDR